jgi:hypothetical protein
MAVELSILIAMVSVSIATSFFSLFRRIRIFKSCCCQSDCMDNEQIEDNNIELTNIQNLPHLHNLQHIENHKNSPIHHRKLPTIPHN